MKELYFCRVYEIDERLKKALTPHICGNYEIKRGEFGKPYIEGNPVFFSISHSGDEGVILICDRPCGVDLEVFRDRKTEAYYTRLSEREQAEIQGDNRLFLQNWVAKEAYIKYLGGTVAIIKRLEYVDGTLFFDGKEADCEININFMDSAVYAVCTER